MFVLKVLNIYLSHLSGGFVHRRADGSEFIRSDRARGHRRRGRRGGPAAGGGRCGGRHGLVAGGAARVAACARGPVPDAQRLPPLLRQLRARRRPQTAAAHQGRDHRAARDEGGALAQDIRPRPTAQVQGQTSE